MRLEGAGKRPKTKGSTARMKSSRERRPEGRGGEWR